MIYTQEVENMCPVAQGVHHGAAPVPTEGKWVQNKEVKNISGFTHGVGWCAPQQGACKLTLNVKEGIIQEALVETIGCSGMTHSAAMASEILPGKTILEALNTDLVCDAINTAMRELFLQIVYGRTQSAFSEEGLPIGAGLEDLGKGLRSMVGTSYSTKLKGPRYLELTEGYINRLALDENNEIIGYEFINLGRMMDMIKSGKELKVFSIPNRDLKKFTEQAKRYGVLYCVLRDKNTKGDNVPIDIIARAEDASKIQRIVERFELGKVDKAAIVTESQKAVEKREALEKEKPAKSKNEIIMEEAVRKPLQKEENAQANPSVAKTDKNPPLRQNSEPEDMRTDKGVAVNEQKKPSVKEKLDHYKAQAKQEKEADRKEPEVAQTKRKSAPKQTVHKQPKSKRTKTKER